MSYPNAFCVKCGKQTETMKKHTVLLQNNSRALHGVCATCESEVYKILPKKKDAVPPSAPRLSLVKPEPLRPAKTPARRQPPRLNSPAAGAHVPPRRVAMTPASLSSKAGAVAAGAVIGAIIACFVFYSLA